MSVRRRDGTSGSRVLSHALNIAAAISKYRESVDEAEILADPMTKQLCTLQDVRFGPEEAIPLEKLGRRQSVHRVRAERHAVANAHDAAATSPDLNAQVFVSYAHFDSPFVDVLASRLEGDGVVVWRDNNEILVGDEIDRAVSAGIQANRLFLIVLTPNSIESDWVARELAEAAHEAVSGGKVILPVLTGGLLPETLPPSIRRRKVVTFASDFEEPYRFLLRSIQEQSRRGRQHT
jgi:hypothetical protein